jgi:hypothetical protein
MANPFELVACNCVDERCDAEADPDDRRGDIQHRPKLLCFLDRNEAERLAFTKLAGGTLAGVDLRQAK